MAPWIDRDGWTPPPIGDPVTYDVLLGPEGQERLVENEPEVDGGLIGVAQVVSAREGRPWLNAWVHGSRVWSDEDPSVVIDAVEDPEAL